VKPSVCYKAPYVDKANVGLLLYVNVKNIFFSGGTFWRTDPFLSFAPSSFPWPFVAFFTRRRLSQSLPLL